MNSNHHVLIMSLCQLGGEWHFAITFAEDGSTFVSEQDFETEKEATKAARSWAERHAISGQVTSIQ